MLLEGTQRVPLDMRLSRRKQEHFFVLSGLNDRSGKTGWGS